MITPNPTRFCRLPRRMVSLALAGTVSLSAGASLAAAATPKKTTGHASAASQKEGTVPRELLPFIKDDYAKALAQARARKSPIFIEAWAPW